MGNACSWVVRLTVFAAAAVMLARNPKPEPAPQPPAAPLPLPPVAQKPAELPKPPNVPPIQPVPCVPGELPPLPGTGPELFFPLPEVQVVRASGGFDLLVPSPPTARPILPVQSPMPVLKQPVLPEPKPDSLPPLPSEPRPLLEPGSIPLPPMPDLPAAPPVRYVNKPDVEFDFEVTKKGRSGVKSVSLWVREMSKQVFSFYTDPATTLHPEWKEVGSAPNESAADVKLKWKLPYDGRFDFCLQVIGGNDRKSAEIAAKPEPQLTVILDTLPPAVKNVALLAPVAGQKQAAIKWVATDANLGDKCVKLEYEDVGGKWVIIADGERNAGTYPWKPSEKMPVSTRVRVTVTDLAGNSASITSATPTNLDSVVPEGKLTGVRTVDPSPAKNPDAGLPALPPPRFDLPMVK